MVQPYGWSSTQTLTAFGRHYSKSKPSQTINMGIEEVRAALRSKFPQLDDTDFKSSAGSKDSLIKIVAQKTGKSEDDAK